MLGFCVFFFYVTTPTEIDSYLHTLSLHDALPISWWSSRRTTVASSEAERPVAIILPAHRRQAREAERAGDEGAAGEADPDPGGARALRLAQPHADRGAEIGRAHV